jgi:hypothetical protein
VASPDRDWTAAETLVLGQRRRTHEIDAESGAGGRRRTQGCDGGREDALVCAG